MHGRLSVNLSVGATMDTPRYSKADVLALRGMLQHALTCVGSAEWTPAATGSHDEVMGALPSEFSARLRKLAPVVDAWLAGGELPDLDDSSRYFLALTLRRAVDDLALCESFAPANVSADYVAAVRELLFARWTQAEIESWADEAATEGPEAVYAPEMDESGPDHPFLPLVARR